MKIVPTIVQVVPLAKATTEPSIAAAGGMSAPKVEESFRKEADACKSPFRSNTTRPSGPACVLCKVYPGFERLEVESGMAGHDEPLREVERRTYKEERNSGGDKLMILPLIPCAYVYRSSRLCFISSPATLAGRRRADMPSRSPRSPRVANHLPKNIGTPPSDHPSLVDLIASDLRTHCRPLGCTEPSASESTPCWPSSLAAPLLRLPSP